MSRLITLPIVLVALAILVSFALSNAQTVAVGLWPTGMTVGLPLSVAILIGMAVSFFLGALMLWGAALSARARARRAEDRVRMLQAQIEAMRSAKPTLPPPA